MQICWNQFWDSGTCLYHTGVTHY